MSEAPERTTVTRQELYRAVWDRPVERVAQEFGISDVALARLCRQLTIVTPPRGYWAKPERERLHLRPKFRANERGPLVEITIQPTLSHERQEPPATVAVSVKERLRRPHPAVAAIVAERKNAIAAQQAEWRPWLRKFKIHDFSMLEKRGLRIRDALFRALETHGAAIDKSGARVYAASEPIDLRFDHNEDSGTLSVSIRAELPPGTRRSWSDGKRTRLEGMLPQIAGAILEAGMYRAAKRQLAVEQEAQHQRVEAHRQADQRSREHDERRWRKLVGLVQVHQEREAAYRFLDELKAGSYDPEAKVGDRTLKEWIEWADRALGKVYPAENLAALFEAIERT